MEWPESRTAWTRAKSCSHEHNPGRQFSLLNFIRGQTELCRVLVRATNFPYLKRYPMLILNNPVAEKEGVAGYEIALNLQRRGLCPDAARGLAKSKARRNFNCSPLTKPRQRANPCRHLVVLRRGHWELGNEGLREVELLIY